MHAVATALNAMRSELNGMYLEREEAVDAMLLSVLSGEHLFILGPPGTAKSEMIRAFIKAIVGARHFEVAMSKTRAVEAVLGPVDIKELRENGHMFRKRRGYLQDVDFAFLDEIGKMNPILGHDMLALLNERIYHEVNGGLSAHKAPLRSAFTASNELITDQSDDAAALWDRLLFRVVVDYLRDPKNFGALLTTNIGDLKTTINFADLADVIDNVVPSISVSKEAVRAVVSLRKSLKKESIFVSDRRWRASMKALKAQAFLEGRTEVYEEDLVALRFTLWETIPQLEKVEKLTAGASNPFVERLSKFRTEVQEISKGITERKDKSVPEKATYAKEAFAKLQEVRTSMDTLLDDAKGRQIPRFKDVSDLHYEVMLDLWVTCFEYEETVAKTAIEKYRGKGDGQVVSAAAAAAAAQPPAPAQPAPQASTPVQAPAPQAPPAPQPPAPQQPPAPAPQPAPQAQPAPAPEPAPQGNVDDAFAALVESLRADVTEEEAQGDDQS